MKIGIKSLQVGLLAGAILALVAAQSFAQVYTYPMTFDTAASMKTTVDYNPPPPIVRLDNGTFSAQLNNSASWDATQDAGGNPNSGSVKVQYDVNGPGDGSGGVAWTFDMYQSGLNNVATDLSFDIRIDPSSPIDVYGGYGYFQMFWRNDSYTYTDTGMPGQEFGNPSGTNLAGTWQHFDIPLPNDQIRALTFQVYHDASRGQVGHMIYNIDNLSLTVPEPASFALLGLAVPGLLVMARRYRKAA